METRLKSVGLSVCQSRNYPLHITQYFLSAHFHDKPVLLLENPEPPLSSHNHDIHTSPSIVFQQRLTQADAVFIVTARTVYELSFSLPKFKIGKNAFDGHTYTWHTYGFSCILLGGWISDRKVAMKVRAILASADYPPDMTRALPKPAYLTGYVEDLSAETPGPCI